MKKFINDFFPWIVTTIFFLYKIQDLSLPYFWDEAWSYFPALEAMQKAGPSLLPGAIDSQLYRGHPLLFYFLGSTWMNLFPTNIAWAKLLPLLISLMLLLKTYDFAKTNFDIKTARTALALLSVQSIFIAQASFLLPEILLSLLSILAINSFINQHKWQTVLWVTLALYTKESAVVLALSLLAWQLLNEYLNKNKKISLQTFLNTAHLLIPFGFISIFFLFQKLWLGWVFFPEHIKYISINDFFNKAEMYLGYLLIFKGRNLLTFAAIVSFIMLMIRNSSEIQLHKNKLLGIGFFMLSYLAFSSLNFYSPRYLLSILPLVMIVFSFFIVEAFSKHKLLFVSLLLIVVGNIGFNSFFRFEPNDHTLGYREMIAVHEEACQWVENNISTESKIATHFLMKANLENPNIGYLKNNKAFSNISLKADSTTKFIILSNIEQEQHYQDFLSKNKHSLTKHFERGSCYSDIYTINQD
jgi:hypothetical protein